MNEKPQNQLIDVTFFKMSGKWYASGKAVVNHFLFEEGFRQDIVNTQKVLMDGWQDHLEFFVVTHAPEHVNGFFEHLFHPSAFAGLKKASGGEEEEI